MTKFSPAPCTSQDRELAQAIAYRNKLADALTEKLQFMTQDSGGGPGYYEGPLDDLATDIEALTAVILNRTGWSWGNLAENAAVSRQALHRRLAARGEALYAQAVSGVEPQHQE